MADRFQELYGGGGFKTTYTFNNPTQQVFSLIMVLHSVFAYGTYYMQAVTN